MLLRFENFKERKLIGKRLIMSFSENKTKELWHSFMPQKSEITNIIGPELYSVEIYEIGFFENFNLANKFEKWAAVEVSDFENIPNGFEKLIINDGLYAVFLHKGFAKDGMKTYNYIFNTWLPAADYKLDNRPHFAIMGNKYDNNSGDSEEEIWMPIKLKIEKN